jgi:hypothetical protein
MQHAERIHVQCQAHELCLERESSVIIAVSPHEQCLERELCDYRSLSREQCLERELCDYRSLSTRAVS